MNQGYEGVYIVGYGQTPYEKKTTKTIQRLFWEVIQESLRTSGLPFRAIDGLAVTAFSLYPENVTTLAEHLGLECRWVCQVTGSAAPISTMLHAARAIQAGDAEVIACAAADTFNVGSHMEMRRTAGQDVYMGPWGYGRANGVFALHTHLYMERFGAQREDFGRLAVSQRQNALLNPNAIFKVPLTMEEYLNARVIADPLHLYDCVLPCCGGDAVLLASEKVASTLPGPKIAILGGGEIHNTPRDDIFDLHAPFERIRARMYSQSGCGPKDMQFAQLYDDYPVIMFSQLEGYGICKTGEAKKWIRENDTTVRGNFPVNTGGGQLSAGQCGAGGGMMGVVEAVIQLRGEAGARQFRCERGLVGGYGMVAYGRGLSASAAILARSK